jgi:hypothetical protein
MSTYKFCPPKSTYVELRLGPMAKLVCPASGARVLMPRPVFDRLQPRLLEPGIDYSTRKLAKRLRSVGERP